MAAEISQVLGFKPFSNSVAVVDQLASKGEKPVRKQFDHIMIDHDVDIDLLNVYFHVCPMALMVDLSGDEGDGRTTCQRG